MNQVTIIGNLTRDPEIRQLTDGTTVCGFTVAVNRRNGSDHPEADYFRVSAWRQLGENCGKYLAKGKKVCVMGPVRANAYVDNNGNARAGLEVAADKVEFLTPKGRSEPGPEAAPAADPEQGGGFAQVEDEDLPF